MTIRIGAKVGPYEILEPIGAGGMGEVWKALDTRLDREVAVKALPSDFASSAQAVARFEQEAKVISSLNHSHICTLFDVGEEQGQHYLVMELIEGESLADRLERGPLSLPDVLRYGQQVASALDAAHRQGIIHRDLKPGNVMLTKSGAKLLDFGLAKTGGEGGGPIAGLTSLPTAAEPLTREGTILGTFQYMAPEQLEGLKADPRTDIFALGALLYEMATGIRAFAGETKTSLIAAIVSSQPEPISSAIAMTPPALDHVVRRCLEKDPDDRWQSAHDVATDLQWIHEAGSQAGAPTAVTIRKRTRERLLWIAGILLVGVGCLIAGAIYLGDEWAAPEAGTKVSAQPRISHEIAPQEGHRLYHPRLTPDGQRLLYLDYDDEGVPRLVVKELGAPRPRVIDGTEHLSGFESGFQGAIAPDGRQFAFIRAGRLFKIALGGGAPVQLSDFRLNPRGWMAWGKDGGIYLGPLGSAVHRFPESGGEPTPVTSVESEIESSHLHVFALPNGKLLFHVRMHEGRASQDREGIYIATPGTDEKTFVMKSPGRWLYAGGFIVRKDPENPVRLLFQRFDHEVGETVDEPLAVDFPIEIGNWTVSDNGVIAIQEPEPSVEKKLVWFDRSGKRLGTVGEPGFYMEPNLSPDMRHLAVHQSSDNPAEAGLWVYDLTRGSRNRIAEGKNVYGPRWSPDGLYLYYVDTNEAITKIQQIRRDGVGESITLAEGGRIWLTEVASNGDLLYAKEGLESTTYEWLPIADGGESHTVIEGELRSCAFSPDDSLISYGDHSSAPSQIYVQHTDGKGLRIQVSTTSGSAPRWSQDGNEVFYFTDADELVAVTVRSDGERIEVGEPRVLFETRTARWNEFYDVSPDGERFLVIVPVAEATPRPISVFLNWAPELFAESFPPPTVSTGVESR